MSGRLLSARVGPLLRRSTRQIHNNVSSGGLLRPRIPRRQWPVGANAIHNVPAVRSISFVRVLPRLALKLARVPAMFGASMIAGLAYLQYQATQAGNYAADIFKKGSDYMTGTATSLFQEGKGIMDQIGKGWEKTKDETHLPEWMRTIFEKGDGPQGEGEPSPGPKQAAAAVATTGAALAMDGDDDRSNQEAARDDQMMLLTKK